MFKLSLLSIGLLSIALPSFADTTRYVSPDGKQTAVAESIGESNETLVTVEDSAGKTLATSNHQSSGGESGRTFEKGKWSPDSKFFVFTTSSSGGHSDWHYITFFFSRKFETFRSVDERGNLAVTNEDFAIGANGAFTTNIIKDGQQGDDNSNGEMQTIDLRELDEVRSP